MSTTMVSAIILRCDNCDRLFAYAGKSLHWTMEIARSRAQRQGWYCEENDYCPTCLKKHGVPG